MVTFLLRPNESTYDTLPKQSRKKNELQNCIANGVDVKDSGASRLLHFYRSKKDHMSFRLFLILGDVPKTDHGQET